MLVFNDLRAFIRSLMRYIGNGYTECQVSLIKQKKRVEYLLKQTDAKLSKKYLSTLTQGQRQYRKRKGLCNYIVLRYKTFLYVILKTKKGEDTLQEKWENIYNKPLILGDVLELVIYKDERGKNTVKISKKLFREEIRASIRLAVEKRDGRRFHAELKKLYNLSRVLPYRGLNMQLSTLLKDIKKWQKEHGTKWEVPKFF